MKVSSAVVVVLTFLLMWLSPAQAKSSQPPAKTFTGCLTAANGLLLLQQAGEHAYALHGDTAKMNRYLDHTVQVQATAEKPRNPEKIGAALRVRGWKVTGECHLGLQSLSRESPAWKKSGVPAVAVPGQAGTLASERSPAHFARIVHMDGEEFQPSKLTIDVGQTVEWKNSSGDPHTVTVVPDKALVPADVALPKNAQPFDSGTIPAGMTFSHTFTTPGTYRYYCTLHEGNGMVGEVIVK